MKVILKQDIKGVGKKDQVINAADGYARNFLFPKNLAVPADTGNMNNLKAKNESNAFRKDEERKAAIELAAKLEQIVLKIKAKVGDNGKLFGSLTSKEISESLKSEYKMDVDKKKINLKEPIKQIGTTTVQIKLFEGIVANLKVTIEAK